jgi:predicted peptidase
MILFLHGAGEVGQNVARIKGRDPFHHANGTVDAGTFPFVVVAPVSPEKRWNPDEVIAFLDELLAERRLRFQMDTNRVYLTGHSMGGFATFEIACRYPDRFAAIVPVAGGYNPEAASKLLAVPVWAFHGDDDPVVPIKQTGEIMEELHRLHHPDARFTILHGWGHDISPSVYSRPDLYRWMLKHDKSSYNPQFND